MPFLGMFITKNCIKYACSFHHVCLFICQNVPTKELLFGFSLNLVLGSFTTICQHILILVKISNNNTLYLKTYLCFFSEVILVENSLAIYKVKFWQTCQNYVMHVFPNLFVIRLIHQQKC